jgi:imidazolonepropionase-like amidohydrolase
MEALAPAVRGEMLLLVRANKAADIRSALDWADERGLTDHIVLSGAAEGWRVADAIADAGVPVLAGPVLSVPTRDADRYDKPYRNAALLHEAGVQVALRTGDAENVRNLPFHAGFAAAYGMTREDALRAVTIEPARIFGVDDRLGSLEVGKQANLFVTDGDPFETRTTVRYLFIQGYKIPMQSRHTRLYEEFLNRTPGVSE